MKKANTVGVGEAIELVKRVVIEERAWAWYNNPLSLGGMRPRNWLPLALVADISDALGGRALTQEDLQALVQKDGGPAVCAGCGREFQPVRFAVPNRKLLDALMGGKEINSLNGEVVWDGSFIVKGYSIIPFCGSLFFFDPTRKDGVAEFFSVNRSSCLGKAYSHPENENPNGHRPNPTHSRATAEALVANWRARENEARRRREMVNRSIEDAFRSAKSR